jgi:hypothetical protein
VKQVVDIGVVGVDRRRPVAPQIEAQVVAAGAPRALAKDVAAAVAREVERAVRRQGR